MLNNNNNNASQDTALDIFISFLSILDYAQNLKQTDNNTILDNINRQNEDYLKNLMEQNKKIIEQNEKIIKMLEGSK